MDCKKFETMIVDYAVNELRGPDAEKLKEHLKSCEECSRNLAEYQNILAKTGELQAPVLSEEFWLAKLKGIKDSNPKRQKRVFLKPAVLSAFALLVFAVLFAMFFHKGENAAAVKPVSMNNSYIAVMNELPYQEETLMDMIDYIDEDSATEILNILLENNSLSAHLR